MRSILAKHVICPLHERLLGRSTFACLGVLERTQWLAPRDLRALQREKLIALILHARTNTRHHAAALRDVVVDDPAMTTSEILDQVPLDTKGAISAALEERVWRGVPGGAFKSHTGGSSGEPLAFYLDRRRQACDQAARMRTHRWFGADVGAPELYLWGSPIEPNGTDALKRLRDALFHHKLLSAFHLSPERLDAYARAMRRFQPVSIFGYPSSLARLARHIEETGFDLRLRRLRAVFVTGEVCLPHDRERIERVFGASVADCYGSREAGFIAHECERGAMHITAENVIVEIVGERGERLPPGERGEIVITHLDNCAMPMLRYRTGDVGALRPGRCACGRGLPRMDVVTGRTTDFLHLPGGETKHALSIIYPLRELSGLRQFRVEQAEDYSVCILAVRANEHDEPPHAARAQALSPERIEQAVRPVLGDELPVRVAFVESIPVCGSGKFRHVVSRAATPTSLTAETAEVSA